MSERLKTSLARQAEENDLPRLLCAGCQGYGSVAESQTCAYCAGSPSGLCVQHRCGYCFGRGVVCPECRGQRMLTRGMGQMREISATKAHAVMGNSALGFCTHCMELRDGHMRVNLAKEVETIRRYIAAPHTAYWDMRHQADAERVAYDALMRDTKPWRRDYATAKAFARIEDRKRQAEVMKRRMDVMSIGDQIIPLPEGSQPHA